MAALKTLLPRVHHIPLGTVNALLLETDSLTLIDTGEARHPGKILQAIKSLGYKARDVRHIVLTHAHSDHAGGLASLKRATGATVYAHPLAAPYISEGRTMPPLKPSPGLLPALLFRFFIKLPLPPVTPVPVDYEIEDGDVLSFAGGLEVIHAPGHTAGQIALRWPHDGGLLYAADTAANFFNLGLMIGYEDLTQGRETLRKLARLQFETAAFGHGKPIIGQADQQFAEAFL